MNGLQTRESDSEKETRIALELIAVIPQTLMDLKAQNYTGVAIDLLPVIEDAAATYYPEYYKEYGPILQALANLAQTLSQ